LGATVSVLRSSHRLFRCLIDAEAVSPTVMRWAKNPKLASAPATFWNEHQHEVDKETAPFKIYQLGFTINGLRSTKGCGASLARLTPLIAGAECFKVVKNYEFDLW
jgi:hypothetical protein